VPLSVIKFVLKWFRTAPVATVKFGKKLLNKLIKVLKIEIVRCLLWWLGKWVGWATEVVCQGHCSCFNTCCRPFFTFLVPT